MRHWKDLKEMRVKRHKLTRSYATGMFSLFRKTWWGLPTGTLREHRNSLWCMWHSVMASWVRCDKLLLVIFYGLFPLEHSRCSRGILVCDVSVVSCLRQKLFRFVQWANAHNKKTGYVEVLCRLHRVRSRMFAEWKLFQILVSNPHLHAKHVVIGEQRGCPRLLGIKAVSLKKKNHRIERTILWFGVSK